MDFIIMFIMLFWTGLAGDLILRKVANKRNRGLLLIGTLLVFLILWAEMAVGIFGSPIAGS
jgi:hypothetical protein